MRKRVAARSFASSSSWEDELATSNEELHSLEKQLAKAEQELDYWLKELKKASIGSAGKVEAKERETFYLQRISELEGQIDLKRAQMSLAEWSSKVGSAPAGSEEGTKAKEREAFYLQRISELEDIIELKRAQGSLSKWSARLENAQSGSAAEEAKAKGQQTLYFHRVRELLSQLTAKQLERISASSSSSASTRDEEHTRFVRNVKQAQLVLGAPTGENHGMIFVEVKSVENAVLPGEGRPPKCLVIITLPATMPGFEKNPVPNQVFLMESDLQLIQVVAKTRRNAVAGNPGIGKSVLQWKIIVLLLRPDLWGVLRDAFISSLVREKFPLAETFPFERFSRIVRIVAASEAFIFDFQYNSELKVEKVNYHGSMLRQQWNTESTLVLWDPADSLQPVPVIFENKLSVRQDVYQPKGHGYCLHVFLSFPCAGVGAFMSRDFVSGS